MQWKLTFENEADTSVTKCFQNVIPLCSRGQISTNIHDRMYQPSLLSARILTEWTFTVMGPKQEQRPRIACHFYWGLEMLPEKCLVLIVLGFLFQPPFLVVFWVKYDRENYSLNKEGYSLAMVFRNNNFWNQDSSHPLSRITVVLKESNSWRVNPVKPFMNTLIGSHYQSISTVGRCSLAHQSYIK